MSDGPDVVGRTEAAAILGLQPASVRDRLRDYEHQQLKNGPVWATEAVERARDGKPSRRKPPKTMGVFEVAERLKIARPNVGKWCERRGLVGKKLAQGMVWLQRDIELGALMKTSRWK